MKVPDKSKALKKYMVLFSIVLVAIVVSTVLAGYVGTENVVKDIPTEVKNQVQAIPGMEHLETLSNQTDIAIVLKQSKLIIIMVFGYLLSLKKTMNIKHKTVSIGFQVSLFFFIGFADFTKKQQTQNKQQFENLTSQMGKQ